MDLSSQMAVLALQRKGINVFLAQLEPLKVVAVTAGSSILLYKMVQFVRLSEEGMLVAVEWSVPHSDITDNNVVTGKFPGLSVRSQRSWRRL